MYNSIAGPHDPAAAVAAARMECRSKALRLILLRLLSSFSLFFPPLSCLRRRRRLGPLRRGIQGEKCVRMREPPVSWKLDHRAARAHSLASLFSSSSTLSCVDRNDDGDHHSRPSGSLSIPLFRHSQPDSLLLYSMDILSVLLLLLGS